MRSPAEHDQPHQSRLRTNAPEFVAAPDATDTESADATTPLTRLRPVTPATGGEPMKIAVIGSTGPTGKLILQEATRRGHDVTAFARHADALTGIVDRSDIVEGDGR